MPGTIITNSPDVALLDSAIHFDTCAGIIKTDLVPAVWIGTGKFYVLGAKVQIKNPLGIVIKDYGSTYDVAPYLSGGMDAQVTFPIPTIAGGFQLGKYEVSVELTDSVGTKYFVSKNINLCAPDAENPNLKYAKLSARLNGNCQDGKMSVIVDGVPNYKGQIVETQANDFTLEYPTGSGIDPIKNTPYGNFSVVLYEGVYKITGTICAKYNLGDNVFISILYKVKKEHNQKCIIDLCCVYQQLEYINAKLKTDCSDKEKEETTNIVIDALRLLRTAELAAGCGDDPSDYITDLEVLLGCKCTCNCNEGTPIINNTPTADAIIEGCNVSVETVGLTKIYTINNYSYVVTVYDNGGVLFAEDATTNGCEKTTKLRFNIEIAYAQIVSIAQLPANTLVWAEIISNAINDVDASCCGIGARQWAIMTFAERIQAILDCICRGGSVCPAKLSNVLVEQVGANVKYSWDEDSATQSVDLYLDGVLIATVLAGVGDYVYATPSERSHTYILVPKCLNGASGTPVTGTISVFRPVFVAPPNIYSPYLQGLCPYDITTNVDAVPLGIDLEFHRLNNTNAESLVPDPTNVLQGTFFVFGKDNNGFYSEGVQMQVVCDASGSCSAPQNLDVVPQFGGNLVKFQSAAYPPPMNSYTVKRRLKSDADVPGSYTTLGTPSWNASLSRWVMSDVTAVSNQLYVYRAISNCGGTTPYIDYEYANIICPTLSFTEKVTSIDYSFFPVGGGIDKIEVTIYSDNGVTAVHTDTHLPTYPSVISGSFVYLTQNTDYYISTKVFIGTYSKICPIRVLKTYHDNTILTLDYVAGIYSMELSNPVVSNIVLKVLSVTGSIDACVTPFQNATLGSNLTLLAGELSAERVNDQLNYLSVYYNINDYAIFQTYDTRYDGDTFNVGGATVTVKINHIACGFYPA